MSLHWKLYHVNNYVSTHHKSWWKRYCYGNMWFGIFPSFCWPNSIEIQQHCGIIKQKKTQGIVRKLEKKCNSWGHMVQRACALVRVYRIRLMDERERASSAPFISFHLVSIFYLLLLALNQPGMIKARNSNGKTISQSCIHMDSVLQSSICDGIW